jgi:hypothetical protein
MKALQSTLLLSLFALLSPPARAQATLFTDEPVLISWSDNLPDMPKGRMVMGEVTGDGLPDAVVLNGPKPVVVYGPAIYQSMFEIDLHANDIAILEAAVAAGEDTIVVVNASGITLLSGYDAGNYDVQEISLANAPSWPGATRVKVGDVTQDGFEDLVGLSASGDLLILESVRSETPVETVIPMTAQVFDFVVVDWDGAFENHLAVLRTDGIHVCDLAGTLIFSIPVTVGPPIDGGSLAIFREHDFAFDRLAVLYEYTGLHYLLPLDSGPTDPDEVQLDLFTFDFFGMAVADADLDGRDDLYLVNRSTHLSLLLVNQGDVPGEPTFEVDPLVGNYEIVDLCSNGMGPGQCPLEDGSGPPQSDCPCPPPGWSAQPVMADFTLDGDPDIFLFVEETNAFVYIEGNTERPDGFHPVIESGRYILNEFTDKGLLSLDIKFPSIIPFTPTHAEVIGWRQTDAPSCEELPASRGMPPEAESDAVFHGRFEVSTLDLKAGLRIEVDEPKLATQNIYYFDVRAIRVEGDILQEVGSPSIHAFTTPSCLVGALETENETEGTALRVFVIPDLNSFWDGPGMLGLPGGTIEPPERWLIDRALAPKDVEIGKVPLICFPPNPFG